MLNPLTSGPTGSDDGGDVDDCFLPPLPEQNMDQEHVAHLKVGAVVGEDDLGQVIVGG